ncbi:hypothetical protein AAF712_015034 [Marasmius tenuissimus]|uniref:DUF7918 domain-containing protein n=1 Tax=Marasmius tenuissimus TaxID=585030 RepID=A0ABR2ZAB9_9AGAR|nr:hypothetical protein PM082_022615 [Marasmius tenuissimus]
MPRIGDFSASIRVDRNDLEEYDVQFDEANRTTTCWVASEAGKDYAVISTNHRSPFSTSADVEIDGRQCGGLITERIPIGNLRVVTTNDGLYTTSTTKVPFTFANITTSDEQALLSAPATPDVGLIKLTMHNVYVWGREEYTSIKTPDTRTFHEKTKKGISHQTSFEHSVPVPEVRAILSDKLGPPVATFHFRYRPLGILQAQDIAPRPPPTLRTSSSPPRTTPQRTSRKRYKIELESDGERLEELQREKDSIRAKQSQRGGERPRKKIKREPIVGETIDLTLDD